MIFHPQDTWLDPNTLSNKSKRELTLHNREVKKRKRDQSSALLSPPSIQIRPRSLEIESSKRHKASSRMKSALDQLRNLSTMVHD